MHLSAVTTITTIMSAVWNYFSLKIDTSKTACCKICNASVSRGGSTVSHFNTTNLIKHLKKHHSKEHCEFTKASAKKKHYVKHRTLEDDETEGGSRYEFEFQNILAEPTPEDGESSKYQLSIVKVEQQHHCIADQTGSSCGSGSPEDAGPPGSSGSGSGGSSDPAAQFWKKCRQAGCTEFIFSEFTSRLNSISERILSQHANEEDFNLSLKVLEASGMLTEIFAKRDQELEKRLNELQKESEVLRSARCAMMEASVISFTSR